MPRSAHAAAAPPQTTLVPPTAARAALALFVAWALPLPQAHGAETDPLPAATAADCAMDGHLRVLAPARVTAPLPAQAVWLDAQWLRWPQLDLALAREGRWRLVGSARSALELGPGAPVRGADGSLALEVSATGPPAELAARYPHLHGGTSFEVPAALRGRLADLLRGQTMLVQEDAAGRVLRATRLQHAGVLDALYAPDDGTALGAHRRDGRSRFALWAPTARAVALCLHRRAEAPAAELHPMQRDADTGVWHASLARRLDGHAYTYLVDVHTPGLGLVRHRVTDPYSLALTADSRRSVVVDLDAPALKPPGWDSTPRPPLPRAATDLSIYELHVRDFSRDDASVPPRLRGTYAAFAQRGSIGMRHLRALARAGLTDVHLLPVFDFATVPERGCVTPPARELQRALERDGPASEGPQAAIAAVASRDCFNWGYDPLHFSAPEGSYATDAADPARRIVEFRQMVMGLHRAGLRVGMDVVYNHTSASGADAKSVLDRIVPGYYHRLDADGRVERSTCCDNTATEHRMMARLMIDSAVVWARDYRIDGFRFDLMGHQPRAAMEQLQRAVDAAAGRHLPLIGEGWNFGEVKDGARFVQASQLGLPGSGIATFSDRGRDAVRGGGCCDSGPEVLARQGWINGLFYDPNAHARAARPTREDLLRAADGVRVGLAGTLRDYVLETHDGTRRPLAAIDYAGQAAGYAAEPGEVVNYVENHDNPTLFDLDALKLPRGDAATSREDRARVQVLALATTAFSQGIAYWHAGVELLRSKSLDRNSFDSGDWFNRLDWSARDNFFGSGLPPRGDNGAMWPLLKPVLEDASIKPGPREIRFTRDAFIDLLRIRASSRLFRLTNAQEVARRLRFHNTGPQQQPTAIVGHLDGRGLDSARFSELLYAINVDRQAVTLEIDALRGRHFALHPVHRAPAAADPRPAQASRWDAATGRLTLPPRTALVYVLEPGAAAAQGAH